MTPEPPATLPSLSKIFWTSSFGKDRYVVGWEEFIQAYSKELSISKEDMVNVKKYIFINDTVSIYSFYAACTQLGYPILPPIYPEIDIVRLAQLIMDLNKEFYRKNFGESWNCIRQLEIAFHNQEEMYNGLKNISESNPKRWKEINIERGVVSSIFQRYMMGWRIGRISHEILDNIDFPGKTRIKLFIYVYETKCKKNPQERKNHRIREASSLQLSPRVNQQSYISYTNNQLNET